MHTALARTLLDDRLRCLRELLADPHCGGAGRGAYSRRRDARRDAL